jgi:putative transposase
LLHAHLVFVTKYRRPVFTDAMLTFCEHTMHTVYNDLDVELLEFNGEADHVHLLVAYPPTAAICTLAKHLKGHTAYAVRRKYTGACARARMRGHLWSPSYLAVSCRVAPLSIIKQYIDGQTHHFDRRASPGDKRDGLTRTEVRGLRPRKFPSPGPLLTQRQPNAVILANFSRG